MMERKNLTTTEMKIDSASILKILSSVPEPPYKNWQLKDLTEIATCKKYYLDLIGSAACKELLAEMEKDPRVKALHARLICADDPNSAFEVKKLGAWFLWACNKDSFEIAKGNLEKFLDSETVPIMRATWVMGITVKDSMELENGVRIVPIEEMPDSESKDKFLIQKSNEDSPQQLSPRAAVIYIPEIKKSLSREERGECADQHYQPTPIGTVTLLLNAINGVSCTGYMDTTYSMPKMPMGIFGDSGDANHMRDLWGGISREEIDERAIIELNAILKAYDKLEEDERKRIIRPLLRLSKAKRKFAIDRILDLCMALEMVLSDDDGSGTPNSKVFSLRGCWLIGRDDEHRKSVHNDLKGLYQCRSEIIHTGFLEKHRNTASKKISEYTRLTEEIILEVIRKGKVDWKDLILGELYEKITGEKW